VPKGTLLFLSVGGMHTSPFNFAEPHKFWPVSGFTVIPTWALPEADVALLSTMLQG